ncbi:MAG: hypothetical protein AABW65_03735 [Nanoarchaeota archaeon]
MKKLLFIPLIIVLFSLFLTSVYASESKPLFIDFGLGAEINSTKTGPSVVGKAGDFWNNVHFLGKDYFTYGQLYDTEKRISKINITMKNLSGAWGGILSGVNDQMYSDFNYPLNNKPGEGEVILTGVLPGAYDLYIYGHGGVSTQNGDYTLTIGANNYGGKKTAQTSRALSSYLWIENLQYVRYQNINVKENEDIVIRIHEGGSPYYDPIINGLQLVPAGTMVVASTGDIFSLATKCTDSDNGTNYYVKGEAQDESGRVVKDTCNWKFNIAEALCSQYGEVYAEEYVCPYRCLDGVCVEPISINPNSSSGPLIIPNNTLNFQNNIFTNYSTGQKEISIQGYICHGCILNEKCYPYGYRKEGKYCKEEGNFTVQLDAKEMCENNFECSTNLCISGECISPKLIEKIINWFKNIFSDK